MEKRETLLNESSHGINMDMHLALLWLIACAITCKSHRTLGDHKYSPG